MCANDGMVTFAIDKLPAILEARGYDQRLVATLQHRQLENHVIYGNGRAKTFPGILIAQKLMPILLLLLLMMTMVFLMGKKRKCICLKRKNSKDVKLLSHYARKHNIISILKMPLNLLNISTEHFVYACFGKIMNLSGSQYIAELISSRLA